MPQPLHVSVAFLPQFQQFFIIRSRDETMNGIALIIELEAGEGFS
jgi:hypothetical protein